MDVKDGAVLGQPPALWCQALFVLAAAGVLGIQALPRDMSGALLSYGARRTAQGQRQSLDKGKYIDKDGGQAASLGGGLTALVVGLSDYAQVPHGWFLHFYVLALSWSVFWAGQYFLRGSVMKAIATRQAAAGEPSMELGQVYVAWALITTQGLRRLYESLFVTKSGSSPMFVAHWLLGLAYYTLNLLSIWVEGSGAILESWQYPRQPVHVLTPKILTGTALFLFASYKQNECHRHLASLKKYTLPDQGWFRYIVCPHYTSECLIYLALSVATAPPGNIFNKTVLCGLVYVAVSIGIIAHGTKKWYANKFGAEKVAGRWRMLPPVF